MAKLVEILAQKLKEWPNNWEVVGQACDGSLHGEPFDNRHTDERYTICYRYIIDEVTRAEWQAAVDALKAKDTASSTAAMIDAGWIDPRPPVSPSLHAQVVGRANRTPEWNGVGLPPVGMVCEWAGCTCAPEDPREPDLHVGDSVKIIAHFKDGDFDLAAFTFNPQVHNSARGSAWVNQGGPGCFRPIRTPEQIAAEEREAEVNRMVATVPMLDKGWARKVCYALYDNNYRKQEPK